MIMKKFLLSTSAIVGIGLIAAPAGAAEKLKLGLGGFMNQHLGWASPEDDTGRDFVNLDQQSDSEIYISGSTTADNGITYAVRWEIEGENTAANDKDESWLHISSDSLGLLSLGEDDGAANATKYGMPDVGIGDGDVGNWVPTVNHNGRFSNNIGRTGDEQKITYFTPSSIQGSTGLQAAASWIPEVGNMGDVLPNATADTQSGYSVAVTFKSGAAGMDLGGFDVSLQYGYTHEPDGQRNNGQASRGHQGTGKIKYDAFTLAGGYTRRLHDQGTAGVTNSDEGHSWEAGVSYAQGPYKVSLGYSSYAAAGAIGTAGDDEGDVLIVSGAYTLSDGISLTASVFDVDYDNEGAPADANETDGGWGVVSTIRLAF
jgi:outer membrane protein OmpU